MLQDIKEETPPNWVFIFQNLLNIDCIEYIISLHRNAITNSEYFPGECSYIEECDFSSFFNPSLLRKVEP